MHQQRGAITVVCLNVLFVISLKEMLIGSVYLTMTTLTCTECSSFSPYSKKAPFLLLGYWLSAYPTHLIHELGLILLSIKSAQNFCIKIISMSGALLPRWFKALTMFHNVIPHVSSFIFKLLEKTVA